MMCQNMKGIVEDYNKAVDTRRFMKFQLQYFK